MPELPEVETTRRGIEPHVLQRRIERVAIRQPRLRWPVPDNLAAQLVGREVHAVRRRAKYLLLETGAGTLMIHLGMSGSLRLVPAGTAPGKHDHVDIELAGGHLLRYHDPRRFGAMLWLEGDPTAHKLLAHLGPEPLSEAFDGAYLFARSRGKSTAIKTFIMDGEVVVGVGNIYANEALFAAGIHPKRPAGRISKERYQRLAQAIKTILARAIEQGGTTLRDFVGGDGKPGYFKQELHVYGRAGAACTGCGNRLREIRLGQRSTVFCGRCQR